MTNYPEVPEVILEGTPGGITEFHLELQEEFPEETPGGIAEGISRTLLDELPGGFSEKKIPERTPELLDEIP